MEATHVMEVAQLLLSLIHSWGIDSNLDKVCETQLGLLRPRVRYLLFFFFKIQIKNADRINLCIHFIDSSIIWYFIKRWLYVTVIAHMAK